MTTICNRGRQPSTLRSPLKWLVATAMACLTVLPTSAATVWDRTIVHPMPTGRVLAGDRCHFATRNCAGTGIHLGVDLMAAADTRVVSMCEGVVRHNNTRTASIWNSKVIVEHNCGGSFRKVFGHYGHVSSTLAVGSTIAAGDLVGNLKDDGGNSHLHMGVSYSQHTTEWGYASLISDWFDFHRVVNRPALRPTLVTPQQGGSSGTAVSFVWNPTAGTSSYRLVVSRDPNPLRSFNGFTLACTDVGSEGAPCWTNPSSLSSSNLTRQMTPGYTYYWVVRGDNTDWSEIGSFTVGTVATGTNWSSGTYRNNEFVERELSIPGAAALDVTISGRTEANYDFLTLFDIAGRSLGTYSGVINAAVRVSGSSVKLRFTSDSSVVDSGVSVSIASAAASPAQTTDEFARCHAKFAQYFGQRIGSSYACYGNFVCQQTSGPVTMLAVPSPNNSNLLYYYWGGWSTLDMQACN